PLNVLLFVEARLELDQNRDLLAVFCRARQDRDDRGVGTGSIEGHLDREDVRIDRGIFEQAQDRVEGIVRMMQEDVPLSNRVEGGGGRGKESCRSGEVGSVLQIRALQSVKGQEIGDAERAGDLVDVLPVELELLAEKLSDALRASLVDLEPNRRSETPPPNI